MGNQVPIKGVRCLFAGLMAAALWSSAALAQSEPADEPDEEATTASGVGSQYIPDLREEETPLKVQRGDTVIVPIPMSSPTFGTGLVLGGAYFYAQTEEQKASQPASFTGAAAAYTDNKSWLTGVMQQNYWDEDTWRFTGVAAYADFKLELISPEDSENSVLDWLVKGGAVQTTLSRRLSGQWFLGGTIRYLDIEQDLDYTPTEEDFNLGESIRSLGLGLNLNYDTRDVPANPYSGQHFETRVLVSTQKPGNRGSYRAINLRWRGYWSLSDKLVLAADVNGCSKTGTLPLWDTCRLPLRGFPITEYLSRQSVYGQAEARWRFWKRWGLVGFAGAGWVDGSFTRTEDRSLIPSYGVGIRWMVLESQRINIRVDYGRSDDGRSAWYLGVVESF